MTALAPSRRASNPYFTKFTLSKGLFYAFSSLFLLTCTVVVMVEPFLNVPCIFNPALSRKFPNPAYPDDVCRRTRFGALFLTQEECDFERRILISVFFGGIVGWERRRRTIREHRTMSLVSRARAFLPSAASSRSRAAP